MSRSMKAVLLALRETVSAVGNDSPCDESGEKSR